MKNFVRNGIFSIGIFCLLSTFGVPSAHADGIGSTVNLQLVSAGPGSYNGDAVYPYNFRVDGGSETTPLMCISFDNHIYFGESWYAKIEALPATLLYEEAAWLYDDANKALANGEIALVIADQWAAWELFSTNAQNIPAPAGASSQLLAAAAAVNSLPGSYYRNFELYVPIDWAGNEEPQTFIGYSKTPEPGSLLLFGSGLLAFAFFFRRRLTSCSVRN